MAPSPVVARWELSRRLTARRKEQGVDVKTITAALGFSRNYWSAVENDRTLIAEDKLRLLFDLLDIDEEEAGELLTLRQASRARGWWDGMDVDIDTQRLCGLEDGASLIRVYEGLLVPGLLQTPDYTRALIEADPFIRAVDLDRTLRTRELRQRRLQRPTTLKFVALMSEACLHQNVGPREVLASQIRRIISLCEESGTNVFVRVLPFSTNPGVIASSSTLAFFQFESPHLPTIAWQEAVRPLNEILDDDAQYTRLELAWNEGLERSLSESESIELLRSRAGDLDTM